MPALERCMMNRNCYCLLLLCCNSSYLQHFPPPKFLMFCILEWLVMVIKTNGIPLFKPGDFSSKLGSAFGQQHCLQSQGRSQDLLLFQAWNGSAWRCNFQVKSKLVSIRWMPVLKKWECSSCSKYGFKDLVLISLKVRVASFFIHPWKRRNNATWFHLWRERQIGTKHLL